MAATTATSLPEQLASGSLAGDWVLDPARSRVALATRSMWGLAPVRGTFGTVSGEGTVATGGRISGAITVGAASVDTGIKRRDEHLRSADFFDAATHPSITFTSQHVAATTDGLTVTGLLRVRDRTDSLTFPVSVTPAADGSVQLDTEIVVDRSGFGLTWSPLRVASMRTTITVRAVFVRR